MKDIQIDERKRPRKCGSVETAFQIGVPFDGYYSDNDIVEVFEYDILGVSPWTNQRDKYAYKVKLKYGDIYIDACENFMTFDDLLDVLEKIKNAQLI